MPTPPGLGMKRQGLVLQGHFRAQALPSALPSSGGGGASLAQLKPTAALPGMAPPIGVFGARAMIAQPRSERQASSRAGWPSSPVRATGAPGRGEIRVARLRPAQIQLAGAGTTLPPALRRAAESILQADLSTVRVHESPAARAIGAAAFTLGEDICFAPGLFAPRTPAGLELLGHELTHVVQQRQGRVHSPFSDGIAVVQDPALEAEADRVSRLLRSYATGAVRSTTSPIQPRLRGIGPAAPPAAAAQPHVHRALQPRLDLRRPAARGPGISAPARDGMRHRHPLPGGARVLLMAQVASPAAASAASSFASFAQLVESAGGTLQKTWRQSTITDFLQIPGKKFYGACLAITGWWLVSPSVMQTDLMKITGKVKVLALQAAYEKTDEPLDFLAAEFPGLKNALAEPVGGEAIGALTPENLYLAIMKSKQVRFLIGLQPAKDGDGHALGVIKSDGKFWFIDANEGTAYFADKDKFWKFIYYYCTDKSLGLQKDYATVYVIGWSP